MYVTTAQLSKPFETSFLLTPGATTLDPVPSSLAYSCTNVSRYLRRKVPWQSHFLPCLSLHFLCRLAGSGNTTGQSIEICCQSLTCCGNHTAFGVDGYIEGSRIFEDNQQDLVVRSQTTYLSPTSSLNPPSSFPPSLHPFFPSSQPPSCL